MLVVVLVAGVQVEVGEGEEARRFRGRGDSAKLAQVGADWSGTLHPQVAASKSAMRWFDKLAAIEARDKATRTG